MKKILFAIIAILTLASCDSIETQSRLQSECSKLRKERETIQTQINSSSARLTELRDEVNELGKLKSSLINGREVKYIVKFKIKQGTFTLDVFEHIKNNMNSIEVEIPVSKSFYDRLSVGQDITDSFKWGSLVFNGDFSTLHMKVIGKRIE